MEIDSNFIVMNVCHECKNQITAYEPYVRFKIPGKTDWMLFHNKRVGSDCWEAYLRRNLGIRVMEIKSREPVNSNTRL